MKIGLYANTHGIGYRDDVNNYTRSVPGELLKPVEVAQCAERSWDFTRCGFPIMCVCLRKLRALTLLIKLVRERIRLGTRCLMRPWLWVRCWVYIGDKARYECSGCALPSPVSDARQFATVDVLAAGRLLFGVGAGWMAEEFEALGIGFAERGKRTVECIEIYKRCWSEDFVSFDGEYYSFNDISMDPKPLQEPRPPIIYGGVSPLGAKRAAHFATVLSRVPGSVC